MRDLKMETASHGGAGHEHGSPTIKPEKLTSTLHAQILSYASMRTKKWSDYHKAMPSIHIPFWVQGHVNYAYNEHCFRMFPYQNSSDSAEVSTRTPTNKLITQLDSQGTAWQFQPFILGGGSEIFRPTERFLVTNTDQCQPELLVIPQVAHSCTRYWFLDVPVDVDLPPRNYPDKPGGTQLSHKGEE